MSTATASPTSPSQNRPSIADRPSFQLRRANTIAIATKSGVDSPLYASLVSEHPQNALIRQAALFTKSYMSSPRFDSSHDFNHILSVTALALEIFKREQSTRETEGKPLLNKKIVILGALLHDVDDKKYALASNTNGVKTNGNSADAPANIFDLMISWNADEHLASLVSRLCSGVSYTTEISNPAVVQDTISKIPELAVVQDADRLDALGAVGIGRCFHYGGAKGRNMGDSVGHFVEKLLKLERMMKTASACSRSPSSPSPHSASPAPPASAS